MVGSFEAIWLSAVELAQRGVDADADVSQSGVAERVLGNALFYMERTDEALQWMSRMLESARRSENKGRIAHAALHDVCGCDQRW